MPVQALPTGIDLYYEVQGEGEPVVLIPYLAADQACYAFQVAEYAKHFTCFTVDLRGAGLSAKPEGTYTTALLADDVAAFMQAAGVERAHISGLSLGAATGMWLAATLAFGWYVGHFADYSLMYGSLGVSIALLVWMYIVSVIVLIGAEFNAMLFPRVVAERSQQERIDNSEFVVP